jgi:hypothetical protein
MLLEPPKRLAVLLENMLPDEGLGGIGMSAWGKDSEFLVSRWLKLDIMAD